MEKKYNVYAGRTSRFLGNMTLEEVQEKFEEWAMRINEENETIYILELM